MSITKMHRLSQILVLFIVYNDQQMVRAERHQSKEMHELYRHRRQDHQTALGNEHDPNFLYNEQNHHQHAQHQQAHQQHQESHHHPSHHQQAHNQEAHHHPSHHQQAHHHRRQPRQILPLHRDHQHQRIPPGAARFVEGGRRRAEEGSIDRCRDDQDVRFGSEELLNRSLRSSEQENGSPTGYLMKKKTLNPSQVFRKLSLTRKVDDILLRFNGQCAYLRQISPKYVKQTLKQELYRIDSKLKVRILFFTYACLDKLIINILFPFSSGMNYSREFEAFNETFINIQGNIFSYDGWSFKHSPIVEKDSPKYTRNFMISVQLLFLACALLAGVVLIAIVVVQCYYCIEEQILKPPLLDLTRYSDDEMPKCMRSEGGSKRGSARSIPSVYGRTIPGLQNYRDKDGNPVKLDVYGPNSTDESIDEINCEWSSVVEFPLESKQEEQVDPQIYATVNKSAKPKGLLTTAETPDEPKADSDTLVPLFQCQSLNSDYDFVPQDDDSDFDSFDDTPPLESPCITRVTRAAGEHGPPSLETDL